MIDSQIFRLPFLVAVIVFITAIPVCSFAQGELDNQNKIYYNNESTRCIIVKNNGIGAGWRYAERLDGFKKKLYEIELTNLKDPKEKKQSSSNFAAGSRYIYGKLNSCFLLRGGMGLQTTYFEKKDKGGIDIKGFYTGGISLAFLKPVYFKYIIGDSSVTTRFNPDPNYQIDGTASFLTGISKTKISPGAYVKYGVNFDYSKREEIIKSVEVGVCIDVFLLKVPILDNGNNNQIIPSMYLIYRWGKIVNDYLKKQEQNGAN